MAITPVTIQTEAQEKKVFEPTKFMNDLTNLSTAINTLISALESDDAGTSGSDYVQCRPVSGINDDVGGSLNLLLTALKTYVDAQVTAINDAMAGIVLGSVSDGSITPEKLSFDPATQTELENAISGVQLEVTGAASSIVDANLTASKVLVSNASGKVSAHTLASSILSYLTNLTGDVQSQLNAKQASITGGALSIVTNNLSTDKVLISDISGKVAASSLTTTKLGYLASVTSNIQTQINGKLGSTAKAVNSDKVDGHKVFVQSGTPTASASGDIWIQT